MTPEILDYCLTKARLIEFSTEEILETLQTEEDLECFCHSLANVIDSDDFLLAEESLLNKVRGIVREKRFVYPKNSSLTAYFNKFVEFYNYASCQSEETIRELQGNWLEEEVLARNLPRISIGYTVNDLLQYVKYDYYYMAMLISDVGNIELRASRFLATVYWTLRLFPEFFEENPEAIDKAIAFTTFCQEKESGARRKTRKTAKVLLEELESMTENEVAYELQYTKRKDTKKEKE